MYTNTNLRDTSARSIVTYYFFLSLSLCSSFSIQWSQAGKSDVRRNTFFSLASSFIERVECRALPVEFLLGSVRLRIVHRATALFSTS